MTIKADMTYGDLKPPKPVKPKEAYQLRKEYEREKKKFFERAMVAWRKEQRSKMKMLNTKDLCDIFQVSDRTVLRWRRDGKLPYYNINGTIRYSHKEIKAYIKRLKFNQLERQRRIESSCLPQLNTNSESE